jgi:hypothetical protein
MKIFYLIPSPIESVRESRGSGGQSYPSVLASCVLIVMHKDNFRQAEENELEEKHFGSETESSLFAPPSTMSSLSRCTSLYRCVCVCAFLSL